MTVAVSTINPTIVHVEYPDAVAFQVVDRSRGDGVRGDWGGPLPGVVRPSLDWKVEHRGLETDGLELQPPIRQI